MSDKQRRTRRQFTAEFKRDALELVRTSGRPIAVIARELGIYDSTWATGSARTATQPSGVGAGTRRGAQAAHRVTESWSRDGDRDAVGPPGSGRAGVVAYTRAGADVQILGA